jgi:hypothetical protein
MKSYKKTADVLTIVADFHEKIDGIYKNLNDGTDRDRLSLLLDYLSRHHERLKKALKEQGQKGEEAGVSEIINETWIQYVPESEYLTVEGIDVSPDMSVDNLVDTAMTLNDRLITFFQTLSQNMGLPPQIQELFNRLSEMEEQEKKNLAETADQLKKL